MSPMGRLGLGVAVATFVLVSASPSSAQGQPTVSLDRTGTAAGEEILVSGAGWPAGTTLIVELCGREARNGSVDCDVSRQQVAGVADDGTFRAPLVVGLPPVPCPCVVRAVDQNSPLQATGGIAVQGLPTVALEDPGIGRRLALSDVRLSGSTVREWFGATPSRTLTFTVTNIGDAPSGDLRLRLAVGRGDEPTGIVATPAVGDLRPGESTTVETPVSLDLLSFGQYTALVEIEGLSEPERAVAATSAHPWALLAIAAGCFQLFLLHLRNRLRARLHDSTLDEIGWESDDAAPQYVMELTGGAAALDDPAGIDGVTKPMGQLPPPATAPAIALGPPVATDVDEASAGPGLEGMSPTEEGATIQALWREASEEIEAVRHEVARLAEQAIDAVDAAVEDSERLVAEAAERAAQIERAAEASREATAVALEVLVRRIEDLLGTVRGHSDGLAAEEDQRGPDLTAVAAEAAHELHHSAEDIRTRLEEEIRAVDSGVSAFGDRTNRGAARLPAEVEGPPPEDPVRPLLFAPSIGSGDDEVTPEGTIDVRDGLAADVPSESAR